jgi:hypothetical protein
MSDQGIDDDFDHEERWGLWRLVVIIAVFWGALFAGWTLAYSAGTVTDTKSVLLQRSGVTQTPNPASITACLSRMAEMIEAEKARRTSGYVTYRCMDVSQSYVKFAKGPVTPPPPPPPPPVAQLQVYACPEAGVDGRILESLSVVWPNCPPAAFVNPSKSLVVAVNPGSLPLMWRLASRLTDERIWTQTGTVGAWVRATSIDWGTVTAPAAGTANLKWTPSPSSNVAGYRLLYGTRIDALVQSIDTIPPSPTALKIEGLAPGSYFFAMQAYTTTGAHGPLSDILNVAIP